MRLEVVAGNGCDLTYLPTERSPGGAQLGGGECYVYGISLIFLIRLIVNVRTNDQTPDPGVGSGSDIIACHDHPYV